MFTTSKTKASRTLVQSGRYLITWLKPAFDTSFGMVFAISVFSFLFMSSSPSVAQSGWELSEKDRVKTVTLTSFEFQKEYADLLILFNQAGINVTNNCKIKRRQNVLKEVKFQLMHPQGMNFKLRITAFTTVEFQFVLDEQRQCQYFTYRINGEEVYQKIPMDTKGFKTYVCFDTGIVQTGETNRKIEKFY